MLKYKGRVIRVYKERRCLPNGVCADLDIVKHPGAVLIVPFLEKNKIVLLKQFRPVINDYLYELPAGTLNAGESPLACAGREIIEEAGFRARKLILLGAIFPVPGYSTEKIYIYKAQGLRKESAPGDSDEIIERMTVTRQQVKALFKKGRLVDAKTIAAFAFCGWL
ncbi:MAG TPA: ADP-ribose pyrophosphatase [Candidatus Omnitrophica bacterium]|nr:ADP-ribose pyrophosphatase [Candidatus Omnitrophota bacterium]